MYLVLLLPPFAAMFPVGWLPSLLGASFTQGARLRQD